MTSDRIAEHQAALHRAIKAKDATIHAQAEQIMSLRRALAGSVRKSKGGLV